MRSGISASKRSKESSSAGRLALTRSRAARALHPPACLPATDPLRSVGPDRSRRRRGSLPLSAAIATARGIQRAMSWVMATDRASRSQIAKTDAAWSRSVTHRVLRGNAPARRQLRTRLTCCSRSG